MSDFNYDNTDSAVVSSVCAYKSKNRSKHSNSSDDHRSNSPDDHRSNRPNPPEDHTFNIEDNYLVDVDDIQMLVENDREEQRLDVHSFTNQDSIHTGQGLKLLCL